MSNGNRIIQSTPQNLRDPAAAFLLLEIRNEELEMNVSADADVFNHPPKTDSAAPLS
jgi:hypothetical protein